MRPSIHERRSSTPTLLGRTAKKLLLRSGQVVRLRSVVPDISTCWHHDFLQTVQPSLAGSFSTRNLHEGLHRRTPTTHSGGLPWRVKQHLPRLLRQELRLKIRMAIGAPKTLNPWTLVSQNWSPRQQLLDLPTLQLLPTRPLHWVSFRSCSTFWFSHDGRGCAHGGTNTFLRYCARPRPSQVCRT